MVGPDPETVLRAHLIDEESFFGMTEVLQDPEQGVVTAGMTGQREQTSVPGILSTLGREAVQEKTRELRMTDSRDRGHQGLDTEASVLVTGDTEKGRRQGLQEPKQFRTVTDVEPFLDREVGEAVRHHLPGEGFDHPEEALDIESRARIRMHRLSAFLQSPLDVTAAVRTLQLLHCDSDHGFRRHCLTGDRIQERSFSAAPPQPHSSSSSSSYCCGGRSGC